MGECFADHEPPLSAMQLGSMLQAERKEGNGNCQSVEQEGGVVSLMSSEDRSSITKTAHSVSEV